jgi:conjugative transfer region lipoprotein (TIGR03751 family)
MNIKLKLISHRNWTKSIFTSPFVKGGLRGIFLCWCLSLCLTACSTAGDAIPQGGPSMLQVYEEAMAHSNGATINTVRNTVSDSVNTSVAYNGINQLSPYTHTAENETNNLFPTLPNPQIVMYVYPHLAGQDEAPVPGYSTAFNLFERVHYAMPGETQLTDF